MRARIVSVIVVCSQVAVADAPKPKSPPAGTVGTCVADAKVADVADGQQPAAIAGCPTPMEYSRGNGIKFSEGDAVVATALPTWDLPGGLAYACAYACAPAGAHVALLGWSLYGDDRPLRNDYSAYVVTDTAAKKWTVVSLWRHTYNKWWNISGDFHRPREPIHSFDHAPSSAEIDAVLAADDWTLAATTDVFKLLAGNMIDENWPSAPPRHFPAGFEK